MADESLKSRRILCVHMSYFTGPAINQKKPNITETADTLKV